MTSFVDDDGNYLDYSGEDFSITRQVATFRNFKIKGDISVSFDLPHTSTNRNVLGYSGPSQIGNPAFSKLPFNLMRSGNFSLKGFIVIQEDKGETLDCVFISGNGNWFRALEFPCNEVINPDWTVTYDALTVISRRAVKEGIIFPMIDYAFRHEKFDNKWADGPQRAVVGTTSLSNDTDSIIKPVFPCIYLHTLVQEIANKSLVKISGTLMQDALYKSIIITPDGPDLIEPSTGAEIRWGAGIGGLLDPVSIGAIAPGNIKAVDLIKWLCISLGCIPTFDEFSQTLSLDLFDKLKKEDAEDWSNYFVSNTTQYYKFFQNNYVTIEQPDTEEITEYNNINAVKYGEVNIQSDKTDESISDVYESPFLPSKDAMGTSFLKWATPYVEFYKLVDQESFRYTSVTVNGSGLADFNGTGFPFASPGVIVRIVDDNGTYTGFHYPFSVGTFSATVYGSFCQFVSNSTGTIFIQTVEKKQDGPRALIVMPDVNVNNLSSQVNWAVWGNNRPSMASAYYSKPRYGYNTPDLYRNALAYGEINLTGYTDYTLEETHLRRVKIALGNPVEQCYFTLPEAVQKSYKFNKLVYLKTKKLNGYFFVEKIENYKDSKTPVRCDLVHADG